MKIGGIAFLGAVGAMLTAQISSLQFGVIYVCPAVNASAPASAQAGPGGFRVGDTVRSLTNGWQEAKIIEIHGRSYLVQLPNGINVSKL